MVTIVMQTVYGIDVEMDDEHFHMVEHVTAILEEVVTPGHYLLVEAIPMLRYLPSWVPGSGFKCFAEAAKSDFIRIIDKLYECGIQKMV